LSQVDYKYGQFNEDLRRI